MSRLMFAALTSVAVINTNRAAAQRATARDLLDFPLGLLAEAPALSGRMAGGLWNPANAMLRSSTRAAFGFAGLTTPQELGVKLNMIAGAYKMRSNFTGSLSAAQASVADILRTDTDPNSLGGEIPYGTTVLSLGGATTLKNATLGVSARYRWGNADADHSHAFGVDFGAVVDSVVGTPVRLAASTFLFSPSSSSNEATYFAAADVPVFTIDSTLVVRGGFSASRTEGRGDDRYAFGTATYKQIDVSSGLSIDHDFGNSSRRWRLGLGLRRAGYTVAIGREDGGAGVGASYQFLLTRAIK